MSSIGPTISVSLSKRWSKRSRPRRISKLRDADELAAVGRSVPSSVSVPTARYHRCQWVSGGGQLLVRRTAVTVFASSRISTLTGDRSRIGVFSPPRKWSKNSAWICSAGSE